MAVYDLKITTLTPLHIGDGNELRQDFDFVVRSGRTYRLDEDQVLRLKEEQLRPDPAGRYPLPGRLLSEADFSNSVLFRYVLPGAPRSSKTDARLKSFIKDIHDTPYIPGSSLKGALRTALAWQGWKEVKPTLNRSAIGHNRSWAGQALERELFSPDAPGNRNRVNPNYDLLKTLHVADLFGPKKAAAGLVLVNAQVLTRKNAGSPVELEALKGDIVLRGSITIDESLFQPEYDRTLKYSNRKHWLDELAARVQSHSLARIQELVEWYENAENGAQVAAVYRQLQNAKLADNQAVLQLGWGSGWDGKTFWTHLTQDIHLFEDLIRDFRMHKQQRQAPPRRPGDPFPRSKRAAMVIKDGKPYPARPFGWVLMELNPR